MSIVAQRRHDNKRETGKDDLAIWPFEPMPIMTDTEVLFCQINKRYQSIMFWVQLSRIIAPSEDAGSDKNFGLIESAVKAWIMYCG